MPTSADSAYWGGNMGRSKSVYTCRFCLLGWSHGVFYKCLHMPILPTGVVEGGVLQVSTRADSAYWGGVSLSGC